MASDQMYLQYYSHFPKRTLSWRWDYAKKLLSKSSPLAYPESDDPLVNRALHHLSADRTVPHARRTKHVKFDPAIQRAEELSWDTADPKKRSYLEALLLTEEPFDRVAMRCELDTQTVEAYAAFFFEVRSCPKARDWLLFSAVKCGPFNDFAGAKEGGLWKYFAMFGGIIVLEEVMAATGDLPWPEGEINEDPAAIEKRKMKTRLLIQLTLAKSDREFQQVLALNDKLQIFDYTPNICGDKFSAPRMMKDFLASIDTSKQKARKSSQSRPASKKQRKAKDIASGQQSLPVSKLSNPVRDLDRNSLKN